MRKRKLKMAFTEGAFSACVKLGKMKCADVYASTIQRLA